MNTNKPQLPPAPKKNKQKTIYNLKNGRQDLEWKTFILKKNKAIKDLQKWGLISYVVHIFKSLFLLFLKIEVRSLTALGSFNISVRF